METPCPPYYAEPTHEETLLFSTSSYVRSYNDWYQCTEGAYCNAPSFLGYSPPGEGKLWEEAWIKLDGGYPCNPALEASSSGRVPEVEGDNSNNGNGNNNFNNQGGFTLSDRPTNKPTRREELPSLISGQVWYDSNGDGLKNQVSDVLTRSDYNAATKERGAGLSNMKITLRECESDKLLAVTYSFPRPFGLGGDGGVQVIDASYIQSIQAQEQESSLYSNTNNDGLGIGNTESKLGFYSFRILPSQLPGEFYVVFESPEDYRVTGGSGDYWEVYDAAMRDDVQPTMEAPSANRQRQLQNNNATSASNSEASDVEKNNPIIERPKGPIKHSGYYAISNCLSIQESPTQITHIDAGFTEDSWPLVPYQYASLVVTIQFYSTSRRRKGRERRRKLQLNDSLECRKYQKLKSEGVEVEDIWGCEFGIGGGSGPKIDYKELTMDEGDEVIMSLKDFLDSRISRVWTIKLVSLAHQKMIVMDGDNRGLGSASDSHLTTRNLQGNELVAKLELGFRIRAEYSTDKRGEDLSDVLMSSIRNGADSFLMGLKGIPTGAGDIEVRDILWQPQENVAIEGDASKNDNAVGNTEQQAPPSQEAIANGNDNGMPMRLLIVGILVFIAVVVCLVIICRRRKNAGRDSVSEDSGSKGKKWWQRKKKPKVTKSKKVQKTAPVKKKRAMDESEDSSDSDSDDSYDNEYEDDLSSRFYSDSSKYDPEARAREVGGYGNDGLEDYDDDMSSKFYSDSSSRDSEVESYASEVVDSYASEVGDSYASGGDSYATGSQSYSASSRGYSDGDSHGASASDASAHLPQNSSQHSSATSGRRSRRSKNSSMRSSASTTQSSMRSRTKQNAMRSSDHSEGTSVRSSGMASMQASDVHSSSRRSYESSNGDIMSGGSQSTRDLSRGSQSTRDLSRGKPRTHRMP